MIGTLVIVALDLLLACGLGWSAHRRHERMTQPPRFPLARVLSKHEAARLDLRRALIGMRGRS